MREADWYVELMAVLGGKLRADPLPVGKRIFTDIYRDVEDAATDAAHQLVLPAWGRLKMQASQRESGRGKRVIVLHEAGGDAEFGEGGLGIIFGEPAARVAVALRTDELDGGRQGQHRLRLPARLPSRNHSPVLVTDHFWRMSAETPIAAQDDSGLSMTSEFATTVAFSPIVTGPRTTGLTDNGTEPEPCGYQDMYTARHTDTTQKKVRKNERQT